MSKRILVATDLPFWERSTGAQQRIASLVDQMTEAGFIVRIFFVGSETEAAQQTIEQAGLDVHIYSSARPPSSLLARVRWQFRSVSHWLLGPQTRPPSTASLELHQFRWPWAIEAFSECATEFQPTSIICEYVKLAYLLEGLTEKQRGDTLCAIDTHDVQHLRAQQFEQRSVNHWLTINREQETKALAAFDLIIAIQENEAETFRQMLPSSSVVVCGHANHRQDACERPTGHAAQSQLTAGYLASANEANLQAIKQFLIEGWLPSTADMGDCRLVIAGNVCDLLRRDPECHTLIENPDLRVDLLGKVERLAEFYNCVDIVINPVQFGAGLKIKNCEALEYGKPLITTSHGVEGMTEQQQALTVVSNTPAAMIYQIAGWSNDRANLNRQSDLIQAKRLDQKGRREIYERLFGLLT